LTGLFFITQALRIRMADNQKIRIEKAPADSILFNFRGTCNGSTNFSSPVGTDTCINENDLKSKMKHYLKIT
jgi:hypothetical protein